MAADGPDHPTAEVCREIETYIQGLDVPASLVWGLQDPIMGDRLPDMIALFPNADVTETSEGHFLQEEGEGPEAVAEAVQRVYEQIQGK